MIDNKNNSSLLTVVGLKKYFPIRKGLFGKIAGQVKAVDDVSFSVRAGKTLGLVGESGCGKTTTGRSIIRLIEPTAGSIVFDGQGVRDLSGTALQTMRRRMQIVFQDPYSSLNPRITVGGMLGEILRFHNIVEKKAVKDRIAEIMENVGLSPDYSGRYPHEFSGGQRQRIGIARALSVEPDFMILDEPVSALDVSIQAQILNLLMDLQDKLNLTYLFVAHDLSVVEHVANEIAVMYLGRIVEIGAKDDIIGNPFHPYTQALMEAVPQSDPDLRQDKELLTGDVPSPANPPPGCHFHPRCPKAKPICKEWEFELRGVEGNRKVACILY
ncbi:MAG: dipeptide ABC transporter ATP-binding protein [Candidatus Hatepunaea meridiana]|nr:dipeptide ABC transporter ATP-binding protein [Candidatus Hatepunaea meridiana]